MGKVFDGIDADLTAWIAQQPMFFVATAPLAAGGRVNLSPRGHDCLSVLGPDRLAWVDYTGSGVETIAHLRENGRICLMWCSFGKRPRIVRVHGTGWVAMPGDEAYEQVVARHPDHPGTRAVIVVDATRVSDSCGFGVPIMEVVGERDALARSAVTKGPAGMDAYRTSRNAASIDGLPGYPDPRPVAASPREV
jgi:Pyridoxamine 5'-phosphate oxidase